MRFHLSTALLLVALIAVALGWWIDRANLRTQLDSRDSRVLLDAIDFGSEKHSLWSPSTFLGKDTAHFEERLKLNDPTGAIAKTSKGWSTEQLRSPTSETTDRVVQILKTGNEIEKLDALKLIALYSEAFASQIKYAYQEPHPDFHHFSDSVTPVLFKYLADQNPDLRAHAALAMGYTCPRRKAIRQLTRAFKNENSGTAKSYIAKSYIAWSLVERF